MIFSNKISMHNVRLALISLLFVGVSSVQLAGAASSVASRFTNENPTNTTTVVKNTNESCLSSLSTEEQSIPTQISITKANINLPVVTQHLVKGTWAVANAQANYAAETSRVTNKGGNVGIFGHDLNNAFTRIKVLKKGDLIEVTTAGCQKAIYKVTSTGVSDPSNVETFYPTTKSTLTLLTCDGDFSQQRFIVKAELVTIQKGELYAKTF